MNTSTTNTLEEEKFNEGKVNVIVPVVQAVPMPNPQSSEDFPEDLLRELTAMRVTAKDIITAISEDFKAKEFGVNDIIVYAWRKYGIKFKRRATQVMLSRMTKQGLITKIKMGVWLARTKKEASRSEQSD